MRTLSASLVLRLLAAASLWMATAAGAAPAGDAAAEPAPRVVQLGGELRVGRPIDVHVAGLEAWAAHPGNSAWQLVPYLNGRPLKSVYPTSVNLRTGRLQYDLSVKEDNRGVWVDVLSPPTLTRHIRFSVGAERGDPLDTDYTLEKQPASLVVLEPHWAVLSLAVVAVGALLFLRLAMTTSLLTEAYVDPAGQAASRYSLAKVQMALWFFVIFGGFILIWLATGNYATVNVSVVSLLGISAGTAVGDAYLRSRTMDPLLAERIVVREGTTELVIDALPPQPRSNRLLALRAFFRDLMCDGNGYSIYRFQMFVWTLALSIIFVAQVYYHLAMPTFTPELLYLLGLSSGTYVANSVPEIRHQASEAGVVRAAEQAAARQAAREMAAARARQAP
ncbi:hypothetical protein [Piscinibacter sp. XHJ-5]|uniref:hypothetical protein n=1 Tax=Piscinibacter sp. XHJ-5 TaxID=3037797 RepID=UPI0024534444|nr:hypothetical protein [Piscinibacter sp. XHJ-5]